MASRSIICRSQRLRQIIDLRDTEKSRYFAITEFIEFVFNFFGGSGKHALLAEINWFPSQICYLPFHTRATTRAWLQLRMSRILFAAKTDLDGITHEQTIICRQLFAGHVVGSQPMKMGKNLSNDKCSLFCGSPSSYLLVLEFEIWTSETQTRNSSFRHHPVSQYISGTWCSYRFFGVQKILFFETFSSLSFSILFGDMHNNIHMLFFFSNCKLFGSISLVWSISNFTRRGTHQRLHSETNF